MKLIAESGSTKTDWRLINGDKISEFYTIGFNPYHVSKEVVQEELENSDLTTVKEQVKEVYFYGSGCSTTENIQFLTEIFKGFFTNAVVTVEHDLLGACRALCGDGSGLIAILGTGSNSCWYENGVIKRNIKALGYILGDEGAGSYMGKRFIQHYLNNE